MGTVKKYQVKAWVNDSVKITPSPLGMRINDLSTPLLDVEVVYLTEDGKQRNFNLSDYKIIFETITPGNGLVSISSESSDYFTLTVPADGRFTMLMPDECRDAIGKSAQAYFRFVASSDEIFSTGDFVYTVVKDVYNVAAGDAKPPANFNSDLQQLQDDYDNVRVQAQSAVTKAGEAREMAEEALSNVDSKQDKVESAIDGNIASWDSGTTIDSGITSADVEDAIKLKHDHDNKDVLDGLAEDSQGELTFNGEGLASKSDLPELATTTADGLMSATDKEKLDDVAEGAEKNQNSYSIINIDGTDIPSTVASDTFNIVAGDNISIEADVDNKKITLSSTGGSGETSSGKRAATLIVGTSTSGNTADEVDYLCDGTADDEEINAAIQALPSDGGKILILNGTYDITASIKVNKDNVTIEGMGNSTKLAASGTTDLSVIVVTGSYVTINKLYFIGTGATSGIYCDIQLYGTNNIITSNICINNRYGIGLIGSTGNIVTDNVCTGNTSGIYVGTSLINTISDNICTENINGIFINGGYNTATGNVCTGNTIGIYMGSSSNNTVSSNICTSNTTSSITLTVLSSNNIVTSNNVYGMDVSDSGTNNTVVNNKAS